MEEPKQPRLDEEKASDATTNTQDNEIKQPLWVDPVTMSFPPDLPKDIPYNEPEFYVRKCYPLYYEMVLLWLNKSVGGLVTVWGTQGVGTSIFMAYFFKRYSFENKKTTIITASFNIHSRMKEVVVWKDGNIIDRAKDVKEAKDELILKTKRDVKQQVEEEVASGINVLAKDRLIYLFNEIPEKNPTEFKMVWFTSPSNKRFLLTKGTSVIPKLVMPLWDFEELEDAAYKLNLTTSKPAESKSDDNKFSELVKDLVDRRFYIFGGVARECLATDASFASRQEKMLEDTIAEFDDVTLMNFYQGLESGEGFWIYQYAPNPNNAMEFTISTSSTFVGKLLTHRALSFHEATRKKIIELIKVLL